MSDSGLPQPPSSGGKPVLPPLPSGRGEGDRNARVESAAGDLREVRKPVRVQGEVTHHNRDGTIRIKTEGGEIDVRLRGREAPPEEGQRVEIDIPSGKPPRQVVIRSVPAAASAPAEQSPPAAREAAHPSPQVGAPGKPVAPPPESSAPPPPAGYSPVSPLLPQQEQPPETPLPAKILRPGDAVRLHPLPPGHEVIPPPAADIVAAAVIRIVESVSIRAALVVQRVVSETAGHVPPAAPPSAQKAVVISLPVSSALPPPLPVPVTDTFPVHALPAASSPPAQPSAMPQQQQPAPMTEKTFTPALPLLVSPSAPPVLQNAAPDFLPVLRPATVTAVSPERGAPVLPQISFSALPPLQRLHHLPVKIEFPVAAKTDSAAPSLSAIVSAAPLVSAEEKGAAAAVPPPISSVRDVRIASVSPPPAVFVPPFSAPDIFAPGAAPAFAPENLHLPLAEFSAPAPLPGKVHAALIKGEIAAAVAEGKDIVTGAPRHIRAQVTGIAPGPQKVPVVSVSIPGVPAPVSFALPFDVPNFMPGTMLEFVPQPGALPSYMPYPDMKTASGMPVLFQPSQAVASFAGPTPPWPLFGRFEWPALEELQQILVQQQSSLRAAQTALAQTAPNAAHPARIPAAALFFLAAVRAGDLSGWLGERTADILRRAGREDIMTRVSRDFAGLNKTSSEPLSQDWRALALPLSWQDELHKMMLYYRRDRGGGDDEAGDIRGTRFIFDLDLSRMGAVQLDGFHRTRRLDLIIRTKTPLAASMQQAMRRAYTGALEQTDLSGELSFQNKPGQFMKIELPGGENSVSI